MPTCAHVNDSDQPQKVSHTPLPSDKEINIVACRGNGLVRGTMMNDSNSGKEGIICSKTGFAVAPPFLS